MTLDVDSYDLPLNSFSFLNNVRAENDKLERGPVFSSFISTTTNPQHLIFFEDSEDQYHTLYVDQLGNLYEISPTGTTTNLTPSGYTGTSSTLAVTDCELGGIQYINRADHTPWYRIQSATGAFAKLDSYSSGDGWAQFNSAWRFQSLRAYNSMLIGLNWSNGATEYPTTVFWSDYQTNASGTAPPPDWDVTQASSSAGQNTLYEMVGSIVDGIKLNGNFLILGDTETWVMQANGNEASIFNFARLFGQGTISQNCAIEAYNKAYVFGSTDLWVTDGTTYQSIATQKVRRWLFSNLIKSQSSQCFTVHNEPLNEVLFCFPSQDDYCYFPYKTGQSGCNRALVFNYQSGQWYAYDLPWVTHATFTSIDLGIEFVAETMPFDELTATFAALSDDQKNILTFTSDAFGSTSAGLRGFDLFGNATGNITIDMNATAPCVIVKNKMNFEELNARLRDCKLVSSIAFEGTFSPDADPITVEVGGAMQPSDNLTYGNSQTFDSTENKCDFNVSGRYIGMTLTYPDVKDFDLSGFDIELETIGGR